MPSRRHFVPNKQYTAPPQQKPSCIKGLAARRNNAAVHHAPFCAVRVGSQTYHITYFARWISLFLRPCGRLGLVSAVWFVAWGRHSRHATTHLQLLGTHGYVTASKIIVASRPKRGTGILPSGCWASNVFPVNNTMLCISWRMARGCYGSPGKQCERVKVFDQHPERLPPIAKEAGKNNPLGMCPLFLRCWHTLLMYRGILVVRVPRPRGQAYDIPRSVPLATPRLTSSSLERFRIDTDNECVALYSEPFPTI